MCKVVINIALCCGILFLMTGTARAQFKKPGITLGGYLVYAMPIGEFEKTYNYGGGGEVFGGAGFGKTYITVTAGYSAFKAHSRIHSGTLTYAPVKIGLKHFIFRRLLFINADLGRATVKNKTFNEALFTRGIGAGVKLLGIEAALYYDGWKNKNAGSFSNSMQVKAGWSISL